MGSRGLWIIPQQGVQYGVNAYQPPYGTPAFQNIRTECQTIGATVIRTAVTWSNIQLTNGGAYDWTNPDIVVNNLAGTGITPIFVTTTSPSWATGGMSIYGKPTSLTSPSTFAAWVAYYTTYFKALVSRYGTKALYEIENEMGSAGSGSWKPNDTTGGIAPSPTDYCYLFKTLSNAGKAINPDITIATGGLTALTAWSGTDAVLGVNYIKAMMTAGLVADAISIHPYTGGASSPNPSLNHYPTANSFPDIGLVQSEMVQYGYGGTPLWVTEWGNYSAASVGGEGIKAGYWTTSLKLIDNVYSAAARGRGQAGVTLACAYQLKNNSSGSADTTDTGFYTGTPQNGPNTQLASGAAFAAFMVSR